MKRKFFYVLLAVMLILTNITSVFAQDNIPERPDRLR